MASTDTPVIATTPVPVPAPTTSPASTTSTPQPFHTASLYVGDIHPEVTEALLFELFNAVGPVASIRVCRDAVTRRSLGYAYVNFHNVADAERALDTMNYTSIKGVPCRIMWSQRDPTLRKSGVGNIFVKNLSTDVDNKALYDTFSLFGNILSCKVVNDYTGDSKGYGYVHYETQEAAEEAIEKINGMLIAGQEVFVGQFQKRQERGDEVVFTNCYVKNIPNHWTDAVLRAEFQPFGAITSCVIMPPKSSAPTTPVVAPVAPKVEGEDSTTIDEAVASTPSSPAQDAARGFGFVNFEEPEDAAAAVEALSGRMFKSADGTLEIELYVGKAQKKSERERELRTKFDALKTERINKYQGVNLYVKNLDDQMSDDELREHFAVHGSITSARIMRDQTSGASRGFGFVCYSTPEESTKAVTEMNGKLLNGKPVYVALAQRKEVRRAQLEAQHAQRQVGMHPHHMNPMSAMGGGRGGPMMAGQPPIYGAAPMFYAQPNQRGNPQPPQGGFMYPQQMMMQPPHPRGGQGQQQMPRGGMPMQYGGRGAQGGPFQPMAPGGQQMYMNQPGGHQGGRRNHQGGRRNQRNQHQNQGNQMRGPYPPPGPTSAGQGNHPNNSSFKYTANVRNQPGMNNPGAPVPVTQDPSAQQPSNGAGANPVIMPLTPAALANASPELQKNMIGERLYPMIHAEQPELAGKITGMLLEMDNGELLHLLESPEALTSKINEAILVLEQHAEPTESSE